MFKLLFLGLCITLTLGQRKNGECPIKPQISVCSMTCFSDSYCQGTEKCCRTSCGGTTCLTPITPRTTNNLVVKYGQCPNPPSGPWVCSSRCGYDGDCRGKKKCCRNRCGAMACVNPELPVASSYNTFH